MCIKCFMHKCVCALECLVSSQVKKRTLDFLGPIVAGFELPCCCWESNQVLYKNKKYTKYHTMSPAKACVVLMERERDLLGLEVRLASPSWPHALHCTLVWRAVVLADTKPDS